MRSSPTDRIARTIPKSQEIFNQTFGMPGAIYIECHDGEIMRGREEAVPPFLSLLSSLPALSPHYGGGGCRSGVGSARVLEGTLLSVTYQ